MQFFCYHRDRVGSTPLRAEMVEQHWAYMDRFDAAMAARGPTFADDDTLTGSVHVVDLPDPVAARAFAFDEPCYQAGAYRDVMIRRTRWRRLDASGGDGFLVLGFTARPEPYDDLPVPRSDLIGFGPLLSDDGTRLLGAAALVPGPDAAAAWSLLDADPAAGRFAGVEVHRWQPGGRR
ncbi:MAG: hypothetical protein H6529_13160 [Nocardioides sp.]|nr:hypothetical protein [Nocardioides sp.]